MIFLPESETRVERAGVELVRAESGAIMVLGIFMCTCLVGVLWYLAGVGDALVLRERVQEATDAGAFSGAVLHARGMNLIVLINLVMACILGIRVALKVIQLALVVVGAIFTALSFLFPALAALAGPCFEAAGEMQSLISELREPINDAIKALSKAEIGIAHVVPAAACAGGSAVLYKYSLVSNGFVGISADTIASGLPLQEGTADRLCFEAGKAFGALMSWAMPNIPGLKGGMAGDRFANVVGKIVAGGGAYFCELGSGGAAPNLDDVLSDTADEHCKGKRKEKVDKLAEDSAAWHKRCDELHIQCVETTDEFGQDQAFTSGTEALKPEQQAEISSLLGQRDASKADLDAFNFGQCKSEQMHDLKTKVQAATPPPSSQSNGNGMTPKMVIPKWQNGIKTTQVMGWATGNTSLLNRGTKGVQVGALRSRVPTIGIPDGAGFAFSQAEYFYDCQGAWASGDCNGNDERKDNEGAMWHFKWRARLRRYNRPYDNISSALEAPYVIPAHVALVSRAAKHASLSFIKSPGNAVLQSELAKFLNPADTLSVTIH